MDYLMKQCKEVLGKWWKCGGGGNELFKSTSTGPAVGTNDPEIIVCKCLITTDECNEVKLLLVMLNWPCKTATKI